MIIRHHLSDPLLMAYSAGELPEAFSLVIATHLSMCDECRARAMAFDALGGTVLDDCATEPMADDSLEACLARIEGLPPAAAVRPPLRPRGDVPAPLVDYIGPDLSSVKWRSIGMGARQFVVTAAQGASARLLFIPAGQAMPDHGHKGTELTLVLKGAFLDGSERFGPGDVEIADEHTEHRPMAETWSECICLVATDGKLRFQGLLPRLAQPFFGI